MKKYFLSLVAMAAMLFATSCQESLVEPQMDGTTTFTVQVPGQMGTKATPYIGNVNKLYVQVYPENVSEDLLFQPEVVEIVDGFFTVSISLIQDQRYDIIFWAQQGESYVKKGDDLRVVSMKKHHNSEEGAAFFAYLNDFVPTGTSQPVTLKRPFAQLNLGTTEASLEPNSGKVFLNRSKVKVSNVATEFNTVTGMGQEPVVYETTLLEVPQSTITVNNVPYQYISMDYLPIVGDDQALVTVEAEIELTNDQVISHEFTNVPVRENYRTNIVGNLISSTTDFKVEIDDRFEEDYSNADDIISNDYFVVDNVAAANAALNAGETYVAINYIKNGETINLPDAAEYYLQIPAVDAKLNIVGDDATKVYITLVEDNSAVNGIELNIDTPSATVTVSKLGNPYVKNITSRTAQNTLILEGIVVGDIVVNGGNVILDNSRVETVTKSDSNTDTTTEVVLSNGSEITGEVSDNITKTDVSKIDTAEKLKTAIEKLSEVVLDQDLTISAKVSVTKDVVINGNGKTITYKGSERVFDVPSSSNGANVTFKDITIVLGSGYAERGINYNTNGKLILEDVKILENTDVNAFTYAINLPGSSDNAEVEIKNSVIKGNIALNVWGEDVIVNAEGTEFHSLDFAEQEGYAAVKLNNDGSTSAERSVINIKGGKIIAKDENGEPSSATSNATGTGKINIDPSTEVVGKVYIPVAVVTYEGATQFYSCETLQAAIDKAIETNAKSVRLIADIELAEKVTIAKDANILLDLNGKTIVGVDEAETSFGLITNTGNLNISGEGKISLSATNNRKWNAYSSVISNNPGGNLVVESGVVIEHLGGTDMAYGIDNLTNGKGTSAITTIKGATVKSTYRAIRQFLNGIEATNELYVNAGSTILNTTGTNRGIWMQDPSKNANTGKLVVAEGAHVDDVYLSVTAGSTEWPVEVSIASSSLNQGKTVMSSNVPAGYGVILEKGIWKVEKNSDKYVFIGSAEQLIMASKQSFKGGQKVFLTNDIDLDGKEFTGLSAFNSENNNTFDGQGYTISNWSYNGGASDMAFIKSWVGLIKNVNFENCHLKTAGRSAVVAANVYANIENVTVNNCSIEDSYWACGIIAGLYNSGSINNCVVTNSSVKSNGGTGGIVGVFNESAEERGLKECSVKGTTINNTGIYGKSYSGGALVGMFNCTATFTIEKCTVEDNTLEGNYIFEKYPADETVTIIEK